MVWHAGQAFKDLSGGEMGIRRILRVLRNLGNGEADKHIGLFTGKESLTPWEARRLNASMRERHDIPWRYKEDCCHARAHSMCHFISMTGLPVQKAWAFASRHFDLVNGQLLTVPMPSAPGGILAWQYHVAPVISVSQWGSPTWWVIDPSVSPDRPLPIVEWVSVMGDPQARTVVSPKEVFAMHPRMAIWNEVDVSDLSETSATLAKHHQRSYIV
jgi:hypothetical protein